MSISFNLLILKNNENNLKSLENVILRDCSLSMKDISFDKLTKFQYNSFAISKYKKFELINDDNYIVTEILQQNSHRFSSILQVEVSGSTGIENFAFWENGLLKREKTFGLESWIVNYEREIPEDIYQEMKVKNKGKGEPQWFESNDHSIDTILEKYGLSEKKVLTLKWEIYSMNI